jgi:hypothetical protein
MADGSTIDVSPVADFQDQHCHSLSVYPLNDSVITGANAENVRLAVQLFCAGRKRISGERVNAGGDSALYRALQRFEIA